MPPPLFFALVFLAAVFAGTVGAMLGLGGGIFIVPLLTLVFRLDIRYAIGASIVSVIATSSGAAATYVKEHLADMRLGMFLEAATTTGAVLGAIIAGFIAGRALFVIFAVVLLGIGGGALKVPAMDLVMHVPLKVSTATSNFMIGVTAATSAGVYFARGDINPFVAAPVATGVLSGTMLGTRLLARMRSARLRLLFAIVLVIVAIQMVLKALGSF